MRRRDFLRTMSAAPLVGAARVEWSLAADARPATHGHQTRASAPDVIIVGAGSSGCVLAHRLTADPARRVLLIDAGGHGEADPAITSPARWPSLTGSTWDWGYATEPEPGLEGRRLAYPRGRVLGGSSAIGAMTFVRGHRLSYDHWRDLGGEGWGYDDLVPLFKRSERNQSGPSEHRGGEGPLSIAYCWDPNAAHRAFLAAAIQNGFRADARFDFNGPLTANVAGYVQKTLLDGRRHSAAAAFLTPILERPNLEVRDGALVTRLVVERGRAVGVEYVRAGRHERALAARCVVLCAGVVESPALLMRSGIGPADHLRSHGIAVVADVPGVGQNLQDHVQVAVTWRAKTELPGSTVTAAFFTHSVMAPGSMDRAPDMQLSLGQGLDRAERSITIAATLVQPQSRGEIRLRSADPTVAPVIEPNYLQARADVDALVRGVLLARWFGEAAIFDPLRADEIEPGPAIAGPADLASFVRRTAGTAFSSAGTCRMGPTSDPMAVVDSRLRVRGVDGLVVADASIMPVIVNAPANAACTVIGEKAADLLKS